MPEIDSKIAEVNSKLRAAYIRVSIEQAPDWAAGLMGHSLAVHLQTYRAWIDEATYQPAYEFAKTNR